LHIDDATAFIVDFSRHPRSTAYGSYGYEIYLPNVISAYLTEVEKVHDHLSDTATGLEHERSRLIFTTQHGTCAAAEYFDRV
jgi:hypothetical protein